jgi:hypothetical protein
MYHTHLGKKKDQALFIQVKQQKQRLCHQPSKVHFPRLNTPYRSLIEDVESYADGLRRYRYRYRQKFAFKK